MSQSIEEIQEAIKAASQSQQALNIQGRGTWTSSYRHTTAQRNLSLWKYAGVQEYVPGNLTMTVRAGTTLREIAEIAGAENQWLPLDPFGDSEGTIGATIATCSYGPLVSAFGTPRDLVLGLEAVLGSGEVVRGGGRVVKNVAGYDLCRLLTGSWGTLGAITEVTLRLFARQETESSVGIPLPSGKEAAAALIRNIRSAPVYPWAMELLDQRLASQLGVGDSAVLVFKFGGNENLVKSQIASVRAMGEAIEIKTDMWTRLSSLPHNWSLRISGLPSRLMNTWDAATRVAADVGSGFFTAAPERGTARMFFPAETDQGKLFAVAGQLAANAHTSGLRVTVESMPSMSPLSNFSSDRAVANGLSHGIKKIFDPNGVLNPGLLPQ